jgi:leucyl aminopeptidase
VTVTSLNGFGSAVGLSCSGLQSGVTCSFSPSSVTPPAGGSASSTLTVSVSASAAVGSSAFSVVGTSGALTRSTSLSLTVTPAGGGPQTAIYDATLKAPKCAAIGSSCDSGPSLLLGRNTKGPEPNQPNTINSSCADGNSGTFHFDESNDRLKLSTLDGTPFAPGKTVRIDATVWAWTTPSADHLDLYYAANAASPSWTFVGTLTPTAAGARTLSATFTLPTGTLQAVRAQFRYQGSASACTSGSYNDRDDLIFAVQ